MIKLAEEDILDIILFILNPLLKEYLDEGFVNGLINTLGTQEFITKLNTAAHLNSVDLGSLNTYIEYHDIYRDTGLKTIRWHMNNTNTESITQFYKTALFYCVILSKVSTTKEILLTKSMKARKILIDYLEVMANA